MGSVNRAKATQKKFLVKRIDQINKIITKLETEVEKAVSKFVKRGEKSSQIIRRSFDEIFDRISSTQLYSRASEKTEEFTKEIRRLADEVVGKVKSFDLKTANHLFSDVRSNVDQIVEKLQGIGFIELAKDKAVLTKNQVLHVLNIPSQEEVDKIARKVISLERKIKTLSRKEPVKKEVLAA